MAGGACRSHVHDNQPFLRRRVIKPRRGTIPPATNTSVAGSGVVTAVMLMLSMTPIFPYVSPAARSPPKNAKESNCASDGTQPAMV